MNAQLKKLKQKAITFIKQYKEQNFQILLLGKYSFYVYFKN